MAQVAKEEARERDEAASEEESKRVRKEALLRKARKRVENVTAEWKRLAEERRQRGHGLAGTSLRVCLWIYVARFGEVVDIASVDFSEVKDRQKREVGLLPHDWTHGIIFERMSKHPVFPYKACVLKAILAAGRRDEEVVVGLRCRSGRHRSVAAPIIFEYLGQQEGWDVVVEHFDLVPCNCGDCGLSSLRAALPRAWEQWCCL